MMENQKFDKCKLKNSIFGKCGGYSSKNTKLVSVDILTDYINVAGFTINEKNIIENRTGFIFQCSDFICPKHRYKLGKFWTPSKKCCNPGHVEIDSKKKKTMSSGLRVITKSKFIELSSKYGVNTIPYGALICTKCRLTECPIEVTNCELSENEFHDAEVNSLLNDEQVSELRKNLSIVKEIVGCSDTQHVLRSKLIDYSSISVLSSLKKDFNTFTNDRKDLYIKAIGPGQEADIEIFLFTEKNSHKDDEMFYSCF